LEVMAMTRKLISRARSLTQRFRWPGGRPPSMGGAVPVAVRVPGPDPPLTVAGAFGLGCLAL
jgi:hypothetical protein